MSAVVAACLISPIALRCEALEMPEGIATRKPELSWKLSGTEGKRDLKQTAYRVLVASSAQLLARQKGDLWDSGMVKSDETVGIVYGGKRLASGQQAFWKIRVADGLGVLSAWSKPAQFSIGLLEPILWKGKWIGDDRPLADREDAPFKTASWIWGLHGDTLRRSVVVDDHLRSAVLTVTVDDQFVARLNGQEVGRSDGLTDAWRRPQRIDITKWLKAGENELVIEAQNTAGIGGVIATLVLTYQDGRTQQIVTDKTWPDVKVLGAYGVAPWGLFSQGAKFLPRPRLLRKSFESAKPIKRAVLRATALGIYELSLNGKPVSDEFFSPGWSDYAKRVHVRTYDVTKALRRGTNRVEAWLGDGWYSGYVGYGNRRDHYGQRIRFAGQIEIDFADGSREVVSTDETWTAHEGPTLSSDFLDGEHVDARKAVSPGAPVSLGAEVKPKLEPFPGQPVREYARVHARSVKEVAPDTYVLDLGQNIAGWAHLILPASKAGQQITLRFAERLNPDGTMYVTNLRAARATDSYIANGKAVDWRPMFTFHGFQYIEVTGLGRKPKPEEVVGVAVTSDTPMSGQIETSSKMLNQLVSNARWTQAMNFIDVPTDCPQRDERLGWTGDAQAYIHTAVMLADVQPFFRKWLEALEDAQRADGQFPMVAPLKVAEGDGGPAWADAGVICPWTIYELYGDRRTLADRYASMKKFVEFCENRSPGLMPPGQFHCFGDWLNINAPTANEVIYMAYFAGSSRLTARAAKVLGKAADAQRLDALYQKVKANFVKAYVSPEGKIGYKEAVNSQCGMVLALAFDLVEGEMARKVGDQLVADIESRGGHLSTGFVGTRDIMHVLVKIGRTDVAYRLLHNTTFPSWGFTIVNGATSIWERWDGWTPEKGFQDPGMNSFAHYAFGAVVGWMMQHQAGIGTLTPGFRHLLLAPKVDPKCDFVKGSYDSVRGLIRSEWRRKGKEIHYRFEVPVNVRARIILEVPSGAKVSGDTSSKVTSGRAVIEVGSGRHEFVVG